MGMSGCVQKTSKPENVNYQLGNGIDYHPERVVPEIIANQKISVEVLHFQVAENYSLLIFWKKEISEN